MAEPPIDRLAQTPPNGDFARYVQQLSDARAAAAGLPVSPVQAVSGSGALPPPAPAWSESGMPQVPAPVAAPRPPLVGPRGAPAASVGRTRVSSAPAAPAAQQAANAAPNEVALGRASVLIGNLLSFAGIALVLYVMFGHGAGANMVLAIVALVIGDILRKKGKRTPRMSNRS